MQKICKKCGIEKNVNEFWKNTPPKNQKIIRQLYRSSCIECLRVKDKKKYVRGVPFVKGHIPWSKKNKGKYFFERNSCERNAAKDMDWKKLVKERDKKCVKCGSKNKLHAHHIIPFKDNIETRFDLDNGITLCISCHMSFENSGKKRKKRGILCQV